MAQHRHQEFIKFLNLINSKTPKELAIHIIVDNYGTHKHSKVKTWLERHKRFHFHFIPTSSSWLNLIERWFGELTQKRLRRSSFESVCQLIDAINEFVSQSNTAPTKFVWTAPAERILAKIAKCKQPLGTAHYMLQNRCRQINLNTTIRHGYRFCIAGSNIRNDIVI
jgi:transposase